MANIFLVSHILLLCLNMPEYTLITLNMIEYAGIYLKKESPEYARILTVSNAEFVELEHFDKHFVKTSRKRGPSGKPLRSFFFKTTL